MSQKTNTSVEKRFKITKSGQVLHRTRNQNHFRAKKTGGLKRNARSESELANTQSTTVKNVYLPHN
jgi:ribosomal protein L35